MTTTFDGLVNEVRSTLRGYNLVREQVTFLNGAINSSVSSITVDDGTLVQPGVVEVGAESIWIQSIATNVLTVSPDGRGWDLTTAASHADNARLTVSPPYPTWRIARAINDTIVGTYPTVYGVGVTSFTVNPVVNTYSLPADAEGILQVTATTIGPSEEQQAINRYRFNSAAPVAEFATGNCITIQEGVDPGQTVTVVYRKAPSEIATGDDLTDSGLRESSRAAVVYGAVSRLLSFVDATRTLTDSAVASEFAATQSVGTATQLAAQLTARYQMELMAEQARLRASYPPRIVGRSR